MKHAEDILLVSRRRAERGKYALPLLKGLWYTLKQFFSRPVTIQYPAERREVRPRWRGLHRLKVDDRGNLLCVACGLCAKICPPQAITIVPYEEEGGTRYPSEFVIDEIRCVFCGFCQEACPKDAIELSRVYDYVNYERRDFVFDIECLKDPDRFSFTGR